MMRLTRIVLPSIFLFTLAILAWIVPAKADDATPAPAAAPSTQAVLLDSVDTFWHYGKIARYDLAADAGQKILDCGADARVILETFEKIAAKHSDNIDIWMIRWVSLPVENSGPDMTSFDRSELHAKQLMKVVAAKLVDKINEGYASRRNDPQYIQDTITAMSMGARAYDNNLPRLAKSGELAVKMLVDILRDPDQRSLATVARRALRDLGIKALNPLLAATEMKDYDTLIDVISALGDIGYDAALPYLSRLANDTTVPEGIRTAAGNAIRHIGADPQNLSAAQGFYDLAEKFYYHKAPITPSGDKTAYIWFWTDDHGLTKRDVPTSIFGDVMAMRCAEYTLKLDPSNEAAVGLWLDADTKREVDLPAGEVDRTHRDDPDAHYYDVSAGVKYLNDALARALTDRNSAVAFKLAHSLRDVIGQSNMGNGAEALIDALSFPSRLVRYEAAFALGEAMPTQPFAGSDRIVPLLVEAMHQQAKPNVLIVAPTSNDMLNTLQGAVQSLGYPFATAAEVNAASAAADTLPAVDIILVSDDADVAQLGNLEGSIAHLQGASMIVITKGPDSPYFVQAATDPLMNALEMPPKSQLSDTIKTAIDEAARHAGVKPMTDKEATNYALQAADLLARLALSHDPVLDIPGNETAIVTSLSDPRPRSSRLRDECWR